MKPIDYDRIFKRRELNSMLASSAGPTVVAKSPYKNSSAIATSVQGKISRGINKEYNI